jgi:hypothetical protein
MFLAVLLSSSNAYAQEIEEVPLSKPKAQEAEAEDDCSGGRADTAGVRGLIRIVNVTRGQIHFWLSSDGTEWKGFRLDGTQELGYRYKNDESKPMLIEIKTNDRSIRRELKPERSYRIYWDKVRKLWDVVLGH